MSEETPTSTRFTVEGFYGSVSLVDWLRTADGGSVLVLQGKISILEASKVVGFDIKHDPSANWIARIEGPTQTYNIPGCKVRAVITHSDRVDPPRDFASVVLVVP